MGDGGIHYEDPFATPAEKREPWRRLRGRLAAPVTVWTSGPPEGRAGLTISSLVVADGDRPSVLGLMNDTTDLFSAIQETGAFVIHVLEHGEGVLADRFAGLRPSPGGLFVDQAVTDTRWGPVLTSIVNRACCRLIDDSAAGYQRLVRGAIEKLDIEELASPLVLLRGKYRVLKTDV